MANRLLITLAAVSTLFLAAGGAAAHEPYSDGPIWRLSFVKYRTGMRETYLKNLSGNYVKELEEAKRQGVILSYKIITGEATTPADWNVIILLELKNMAALDGFEEKMDKITDKVIGGQEADKKGDEVRAQIRDYLGIKVAREIVFNK